MLEFKLENGVYYQKIPSAMVSCGYLWAAVGMATHSGFDI